jgi:hypothetical protein
VTTDQNHIVFHRTEGSVENDRFSWSARGLDCLSASGARKEHIKCCQCQPQKTHTDTGTNYKNTSAGKIDLSYVFTTALLQHASELFCYLSACRFSLMQNLSNSPLCLVRTMPAFLRPGNFIVLLARSNADCQFLSGILIIADRLTTASSSIGPPPLGIPRPMLYICFPVSVFLLW